MNKITYVKSNFIAYGKMKTVKVPTGNKRKTIFGNEKDEMVKQEKFQQTGWSETEIDGDRLTRDISTAVQGLNNNGYEVISIMPISSGVCNKDFKEGRGGDNCSIGGAYGYGYGFSYTSGVTIISKKVTKTL